MANRCSFSPARKYIPEDIRSTKSSRKKEDGLDVTLDLKVSLGADVVVGSDLNKIFRES